MSITTDPNDPKLQEIEDSGMQVAYLVLSEEERAKGFVRPVRLSYKHVGSRPTYSLRKLTSEEHERYDKYNYAFYEEYPEEERKNSSALGRFWTVERLNSGCGTVTNMGKEIAETYARDPTYYSATYCAGCKNHFPVGKDGEFIWLDGTKVGS